jgi:hypothetical protein
MHRASSLNTMRHGVRLAPVEFPIVIDRASYFIPTVGISALCGIGGAIVAMVVGMAAAGGGIEPPSDTWLISWLVVSVVGGGAWWVRRRWRIHRERKLVVDREGITYVALAGRARLMRWTEIHEIAEEEEWELGRWLTVQHPSGRFVIEGHAYHGYNEIRELARAYLPSRTRLKPG